MANDFSDASCVAVYNFESITAGGNIVASASSEYSASYPAWKAFDLSSGIWRSSDSSACWLALSWGEGNEKVCTRYDVQAFIADRAPMAWTFQGYDGANWITLDTQTNQTGWSMGENRPFDIPNTTAYEAYRLNVSANNGGTYVEIHELDLRGENDGPLTHSMLANSHPTGTTADSKGSNTLTVVGNGAIPAVDAVNYRQGAGSLDLELDNRQFAFRPDAKLSAGFPWKAGSTNLSCSTTQWVWVESLSAGSLHRVWMKGRLNWLEGHCLYIANGTPPYFYFTVNCATSKAWAGNVGAGISTGQWYFVATVWDETARTTRLYVWDPVTSSVVYDGGGSFPVGTYGATQINGSDWVVGSANLSYGTSSRNLDGKIDEHTVWNRALSTDDIEAIRDGNYASSSSSSSSSFSSSSSSSLSSSSSDSSSSSFVPLTMPTLSKGIEFDVQELPGAHDITMPLGNGQTKGRPRYTRRPHRWRIRYRLLSLDDRMTLERFYLVQCKRSKYTFEFVEQGMNQTWLVRWDPDEPVRIEHEERSPGKFRFTGVLLEETAHGNYGPGGYGAQYYDS